MTANRLLRDRMWEEGFTVSDRPNRPSSSLKARAVRLVTAISTASLALTLSACAGVTLYSDPGLTKKTGIPVYAPKPYLLVARTGAKDNPVEISIVYLNDTQNVLYAKPRAGLGSSKLSLALSNGQLTSFSLDTDSKVPEFANALSGMVTALAGAKKLLAEAEATGEADDQKALVPTPPPFEIYEIRQGADGTTLRLIPHPAPEPSS